MENLLLLDIRRDGKTSCLYRMRNPLVVRLSMEAETHPQSVVREHSKDKTASSALQSCVVLQIIPYKKTLTAVCLMSHLTYTATALLSQVYNIIIKKILTHNYNRHDKCQNICMIQILVQT